MALVVDQQNSGDPSYLPMGPSYDGIAFKGSMYSCYTKRVQPSGYTEPILHEIVELQKFMKSTGSQGVMFTMQYNTMNILD